MGKTEQTRNRESRVACPEQCAATEERRALGGLPAQRHVVLKICPSWSMKGRWWRPGFTLLAALLSVHGGSESFRHQHKNKADGTGCAHDHRDPRSESAAWGRERRVRRGPSPWLFSGSLLSVCTSVTTLVQTAMASCRPHSSPPLCLLAARLPASIATNESPLQSHIM